MGVVGVWLRRGSEDGEVFEALRVLGHLSFPRPVDEGAGFLPFSPAWMRLASCRPYNGSNVGIVIRKLGLEVPDDLRRLESRDLHGLLE